MKTQTQATRRLARGAIIAALYTALTLLLAPISYGAIQLRISEVLCILPYFMPCTAWGLFIGCAAANLLTGNVFDIIFGSLATLAAALITAALGKRPHTLANSALACLMPVAFNTIVVGAVITCAYEGLGLFEHPGVFGLNALYVGLGEAIVLYVLGPPLMCCLPGRKFFREFMEKVNL